MAFASTSQLLKFFVDDKAYAFMLWFAFQADL